MGIHTNGGFEPFNTFFLFIGHCERLYTIVTSCVCCWWSLVISRKLAELHFCCEYAEIKSMKVLKCINLFPTFQIIWCYFLSILVPLILSSSLRNRMGQVSTMKFLFDYINIFHPIILHYRLVRARIIRKKVIDKNRLEFAPKFETICGKIALMEKELLEQTHLQMGFETNYQLIASSTLICFAYSSTKTHQGLAGLFQEDDVKSFGIPLSSIAIIVILMTLSFISFIKTHLNGISEGYFTYYCFIGKCLFLLSTISGCLVRIASITLYFSPSLGLFNTLHHYQGN